MPKKFANVERLHSGVTYSIRTYRLPTSEHEDALFSPPAFAPGQLFVQRTAAGAVCLVTTAGGNWAEADPRAGDYHEDGHVGKFIVEDYALEIEINSIS
ncbi:MAG TPA: hypothetical protein VF598_10660 [Hymenobacter sp.]|jgi:hypothetical protein